MSTSSSSFGLASLGIPVPDISQRFAASQTTKGGEFHLTEGGIDSLTRAISDGTREWMESLLRKLAELERLSTMLIEEKKQTDAILAGLGQAPSFASPFESKRPSSFASPASAAPLFAQPRAESQFQPPPPSAFGFPGSFQPFPQQQPVPVSPFAPLTPTPTLTRPLQLGIPQQRGGREPPVFIQLEVATSQRQPTSHLFSKEQLNTWIDKVLPAQVPSLQGLGKSRRELLFLYPDSVEWWSKPLSEQRRLNEQNSRFGITGVLRPTLGQYGAGGAQVSHLALGIPTWVENPRMTLVRGPIAFAAPSAGIDLPERSSLQEEAIVLSEMDKAIRVVEQELANPRLTDQYQAVVALYTFKQREPLFGKYGLQPLPANSRTSLRLVQWLNSLQPNGFVRRAGFYTWDPFSVV